MALKINGPHCLEVNSSARQACVGVIGGQRDDTEQKKKKNIATTQGLMEHKYLIF